MGELAEKFARLRMKRKLSQSEVARRAGLDKTVVSRFEKGRKLRAPTLRRLCLKGLELPEDSPDYRRLLAVWTIEQGNVQTDARALGREQKSRRRDTGQLAEELAAILADLSGRERQAIVSALADPQSRRVLLAVAKELPRNRD
jgi:transcriptional regulator with XRE-family HTH domain